MISATCSSCPPSQSSHTDLGRLHLLNICTYTHVVQQRSQENALQHTQKVKTDDWTGAMDEAVSWRGKKEQNETKRKRKSNGISGCIIFHNFHIMYKAKALMKRKTTYTQQNTKYALWVMTALLWVWHSYITLICERLNEWTNNNNILILNGAVLIRSDMWKCNMVGIKLKMKWA